MLVDERFASKTEIVAFLLRSVLTWVLKTVRIWWRRRQKRESSECRLAVDETTEKDPHFGRPQGMPASNVEVRMILVDSRIDDRPDNARARSTERPQSCVRFHRRNRPVNLALNRKVRPE